MPRSWHLTWMHVADEIAQRSACTRSQVGAVAVGPDNRYQVVGYNGRAAGDPGQCPRERDGGPKESCTAIHAEANALLQADRTRITGGTLYCTRLPCWDCAKLLANSGLAAVAYRLEDEDRSRHSEIHAYLSRCGLHVIVMD